MQKVLFILGELSDQDIDWLVDIGDRNEISANTVLIHEGQPVDTLYIMLEGTLVVSIAALGDREVARLSMGEVVGEMSFVDARPPSATVKTLERSLVLSIPRSKLAAKLQDDIGFAARFYRALAILLSNRLRGTVKQLGYSQDPSSQSTRSQGDSAHSDTIKIAQARFDDLLRRLKGGSIVE
ncbi:MAG: cyclic nucleotide-binding domain-containing protein [Elainellaceae cyanobacterium]